MSIKLIHISDIHYRKNWDENHGVVLRALFRDIEEQMEASNNDTFYAILSGDIVNAADDQDSYRSFLTKCGGAFDDIGILRSQRFCVPGNHDVSRKRIQRSIHDHEGIVSQNIDENKLNDYVQSCNSVFLEKFDFYREFESKFTDMPAIVDSIGGKGYSLDEQLGIYCLNSALFSSGGLQSSSGHMLIDKQRLVVETRTLHSWLSQCKEKYKVLVTHHPLSHLAGWASHELRSLLTAEFSLFLSGHSHDQDAFNTISEKKPVLQIHGPPLFTNKSDTLGYSIITVCPTESGVSEVAYRQWTKHQRFLPGVSFSGTEDGKISISQQNLSQVSGVDSSFDLVDQYLSNELEDALKAFTSQPRVWVDPIISEKPETDRKARDGKQNSISEIVAETISTVIKAPGQFGLSCLARYLAQQAWRASSNSRWVCLDARQLKPTKNFVLNAVTSDLKRTGQKIEDVNCIVIDSWKASDKNAVHILKTLCDTFSHIPFFVMQTIDGHTPISSIDDETIGRTFRVLHLWALSREHVRSVVASYNHERHIGDEDTVTNRIVNDIDTLNIHRTPLNCLTVLKASEADFDENPVNRTEVLHRVLFILFNVDALPRYKVLPDMKDCEHALGYLVENLLRNDEYTFSRERFLKSVRMFCKEQIIDIDADVLFDVLHNAHILVSFGSDYCFKFTSWLYYFAAHRMHHDSSFSEYILSNMRYSRFPEVIEFYTGIDRQRIDAIRVLAKDVREGVETVQKKCGLPIDLNPLPLLEWQASPETLEKMQSEIRDGVAESNLPTPIKDRYADRDYDRTRPYCQTVREFLSGHSMACLMLSISAAARALRNSDYANPDDRQDLLGAIMEGWRQVTQILFVLLPPLVERGHASFDGALFVLAGGFGKDPEERIHDILTAIPENVVRWYQDDLYSPKMAPLLSRYFRQETDALIKHEMILLKIGKRPKEWKEHVQKYIHSNHKRSFYLRDVDSKLREQYTYAFVNTRELKDLEYLIKMVTTKHIHGVKKPKTKAVNKMPDTVLPDRTGPTAGEIEQSKFCRRKKLRG
jgi:predicted MPP superfamily phosphohydrolase